MIQPPVPEQACERVFSADLPTIYFLNQTGRGGRTLCGGRGKAPPAGPRVSSRNPTETAIAGSLVHLVQVEGTPRLWECVVAPGTV